MSLEAALSDAPTIAQSARRLTDLDRAALEARVARESARSEPERESLTEAATRAVRVADCGCEEPQDYLTRPLESAHRCPNPIPRI